MSITTRIRWTRPAVAVLAALSLALASCGGGGASGSGSGSELSLVAFSVQKPAYDDLQKDFAGTPEGDGVTWKSSYGPSGDQSRAVANGLKADYVNFSLEGDVNRLVEAGLVYEGAKAFVTPRRLTLSVHGVPVKSPDQKDERKGPKVGAPEQAIAGFVKAAGLKSIPSDMTPARKSKASSGISPSIPWA